MTPMQIRDKENRKYLLESLDKLSSAGYRCYITKENRDDTPPALQFGCYGYVITPNDNILSVQADYYGGWNFTFMYLRTQVNGVGCQCFEETVGEVNLETVQRAEYEGSLFASRLKAKRYSSPEAWLRGYWDADNLQLIGSEAA